MAVSLLYAAAKGLPVLRRDWVGVSSRAARELLDESSPHSGAPLALAIGGVSASGATLEYLSPDAQIERYVVFVLHGQRLQDELNFWGQVAHQLGVKPATRFVGYCGDDHCIALSASARPVAGIAVLGYTEYHTARILLRADSAHRYLILSGDFRVLGSAGWAADSAPAAVAAVIRSQR